MTKVFSKVSADVLAVFLSFSYGGPILICAKHKKLLRKGTYYICNPLVHQRLKLGQD